MPLGLSGLHSCVAELGYGHGSGGWGSDGTPQHSIIVVDRDRPGTPGVGKVVVLNIPQGAGYAASAIVVRDWYSLSRRSEITQFGRNLTDQVVTAEVQAFKTGEVTHIPAESG